MKCEKCGSENVTVQFIEVGSKNKKYGVGIGGHTRNFVRGVAAFSTLGVSNLFIKKAKGTEKAITENQKVGICQDCGASWDIE